MYLFSDIDSTLFKNMSSISVFNNLVTSLLTKASARGGHARSLYGICALERHCLAILHQLLPMYRENGLTIAWLFYDVISSCSIYHQPCSLVLKQDYAFTPKECAAAAAVNPWAIAVPLALGAVLEDLVACSEQSLLFFSKVIAHTGRSIWRCPSGPRRACLFPTTTRSHTDNENKESIEEIMAGLLIEM